MCEADSVWVRVPPDPPFIRRQNVDIKRSKKIEDFLRKEHSPTYIDLVDLLDNFYDEVFDEIYSMGYDDGYSKGYKDRDER